MLGTVMVEHRGRARATPKRKVHAGVGRATRLDFRLPEGHPQERRDDLIQPFELVFNQALQLQQGMTDHTWDRDADS